MKTKIKFFLLLFILTFILATSFIIFIPQPDPPVVGDSFDYINLARNMLNGKGFSSDGITEGMLKLVEI